MKRKNLYILIFAIGAIVLGLSLFGILNTMVSVKYETNNPGDCISNISGKDLCQIISNLKIVSGISVLVCLMCGYYWAFRK